MPDQLCLSLWLRGFDAHSMLGRFEDLLRVFPFSRLRPGISALRIYALEFSEPALFEQLFAAEAGVETVAGLFNQFRNADCAYLVEGWWELWRHDAQWQLAPAPLTLTCFGPDFDNDAGDHLRLDLGAETDFLPQPDVPGSARKARSNLQGLLRLARDIQDVLPVARRRLWSESGEDFAARLDEAVPEEAD
jgi:hypothetical protein